jgi:PIN domain nuclease of toxin-antitoxin system
VNLLLDTRLFIWWDEGRRLAEARRSVFARYAVEDIED